MGRMQRYARRHRCPFVTNGNGSIDKNKIAGSPRATQLAHAGSRPEYNFGIVNPPVFHASTCLFSNMAEFDAASKAPKEDRRLVYGRSGTPTIWSLEEALLALEEKACGIVLCPSGLSAITSALLSVAKPGGHILVSDSVYEPTRAFCDKLLTSLGVQTHYYDPLIGAGIAELLRPDTLAVFMESPSSLTFEVQDIPAIVDAAQKAGITTILDNTWASSLYLPAIQLGVDMVVQSLSKFVSGHSDILMGAIWSGPSAWPQIADHCRHLGHAIGPDDAYLTLRGLRTMGVRMERQDATARFLAQRLAGHPRIGTVLHPALPSCPGHGQFVRDFRGAGSVFSFTVKGCTRAELAPMVDQMSIFRMGYSFGGYESLILPVHTLSPERRKRLGLNAPLVRVHIGLEDANDLAQDLEDGLARLPSSL